MTKKGISSRGAAADGKWTVFRRGLFGGKEVVGWANGLMPLNSLFLETR